MNHRLQDGQTPPEPLSRHIKDNCSDLDDEDRQAKEQALQTGDRVFSAQSLNDGTRFWVIAEADRNSTCLLPPGEY